ncbi:unnamed protein product [Mytilus coruscus]|uniref:DZIP3-like HEPN domain-containing protein n=1 Tax=Mytilus coruscus TaxID=42192 RepID=A0A6J8D0B1_MYTCO|nr:unnamed protein product [Mytilus coruscus]
MGSSACEQRELMKLFKCVIDTGIDVLSAFFTLKVLSLPQNGGNFTQFLDNEKHFLYHQWEQRKTMCCACPQFGCSIGRSTKMKNWIFQMLYEANGIEDPAHVITRGGCLQQLCLHKFVTRSIAAHELDITVLSFLLRLFANMSASENSSLDTVNSCRNSICHARSTNCFSMAELNIMWTDLETHLLNLSDVPYQRIIQKQIQTCRKHEIDTEEIAELSNRINSMEIVVDDHTHHLNNNNNTVPEYVTKLEKLYINDSLQIQKSVSDQSRAIKQAEEAVVSVVKSEAYDFKESLAKNKEEMLAEITAKMSEFQEELIHNINNVVFELKYDKPVTKNSPEEMVKECLVLWHLKTPKEWNEKAVADALKDFEKLADKQAFKIKFVREGSLIILTTVPYGILHNKFNYEHAIKMFLTSLMGVCKINTERACHVKATLHILENDEVSIQHSYVLCEDKSTQISIQQEDKCFQIYSYESAKGMDPEELESKRFVKAEDGDSDLRSFQHEKFSSNLDLTSPITDRYSYSSTNVEESGLEKRGSIRSSYDSCKSSLTGSLGLERLQKPGGSAYTQMFGNPKLTRKWEEPEFKKSLEEIRSHDTLPMTIDTTEVRSSRKEREKLLKDKNCSIQ